MEIQLVRFVLKNIIEGCRVIIFISLGRSGAQMKHWIALAIIVIVLPLSNALAVTINTNNVTSAEYIAFTTGATVQNFESVSGLTPLTTTAYTNGTPVPSSAQMHGQIPNLFFHSGGANPNNTAANPGTPVALLS